MKTREGKTHNDPTTESWKYQSLNLMRFAPRDTNTVSGVYGLVEDSTKDSYVLVRETFDPTLQPLLRQESLRMYLDKRNAKQVILVPFWGIWMYSAAFSPSKQALHQTWGSVSGSVHGQITSLQLVPLSVHVKLEQWCKDSNNLTFQLPTDLSLRTFSGATIEPLPPGQGAFALHTKANTWQLLIRVDPVLCSQFLNQQNYVQLKERLLYKPEVAEPQPHAQRAIYDQVVRNYDTKKHRVRHASEPRVLHEMNRTEDVVQQTTESVEVYEFKNPPGTYRMEETEIKTNMVVPYVTGLTRSAPSRKFIVVDTHSKTHKHSDSDTSCVNNIDGCENTKDGTASKTASGSHLYEKLLKLVQSMDQSVGNT